MSINKDMHFIKNKVLKNKGKKKLNMCIYKGICEICYNFC